MKEVDQENDEEWLCSFKFQGISQQDSSLKGEISQKTKKNQTKSHTLFTVAEKQRNIGNKSVRSPSSSQEIKHKGSQHKKVYMKYNNYT